MGYRKRVRTLVIIGTLRLTRRAHARAYRLIVDPLAEHPGVRREDVMISLVGVGKEDWPFGNGLAQYVS